MVTIKIDNLHPNNPDTVDSFLECMRNRRQRVTLGIKTMCEADAVIAQLTTETTEITLTILGVNFRSTTDVTVWHGKCLLGGGLIANYVYDSERHTGILTLFDSRDSSLLLN
jgi:hypothetical protein